MGKERVSSFKFDHEDVLFCKCSDPSHLVVIRYDDDCSEVDLCIHLVRDGFFKRIGRAFRYVFGYRSIYGDFDCLSLRPEDAPKLQAVVDHLNRNKG